MNLSQVSMRLIVVAFAATVAFHPVPTVQAAEPQRVVVEIQSLEFAPQMLNVSAGDVVVWKNLDIVPHTITSQDDSWDSGKIESGGEWQTVITEDMVLAYYCRFHPSMTAALELEPQ